MAQGTVPFPTSETIRALPVDSWWIIHDVSVLFHWDVNLLLINDESALYWKCLISFKRRQDLHVVIYIFPFDSASTVQLCLSEVLRYILKRYNKCENTSFIFSRHLH